MNNNDGRLIELALAEKEAKEQNASLQDLFSVVGEDEMTEKQKETKQVSLKDHRSKLGEKLTYIRKHKKIGRNETCPCGSGLKYKKCCLKRG